MAPRARLWRWVAAVVPAAVLIGAVWLARPLPLPLTKTIKPLLWERGAGVTTDGTRVYQVVTREGQSVLQHVAISGGDPVQWPLPFPGEVRLLDVIPGESALLVSASREESGVDEDQGRFL